MLAISGFAPKAAFKTGHHFRVAVIYTFEEEENPEFKETTKILIKNIKNAKPIHILKI